MKSIVINISRGLKLKHTERDEKYIYNLDIIISYFKYQSFKSIN